MSIRRVLSSLFPSVGLAGTYVARTGVTANTGATAITMPVSGSFTPGLSNGKVRVKNASVGASSTTIVSSITGTDGTTTVNLYGGDTAASASGTGIDHVYDFFSDLFLTSITVNVTVATANCTVDVEVAGNS